MGIETEADQYGEGSEKGTRTVAPSRPSPMGKATNTHNQRIESLENFDRSFNRTKVEMEDKKFGDDMKHRSFPVGERDGERGLIKAFRKDQELIDEMDFFLPDEDHFHLWWLGQSGFLLEWKGKRVLIDPYLSDSLTKKYAATDKPHIRMSERVIDPGFLENISIVTSSHNHTDHLDAETLMPIFKNNSEAKFIIPEANREFVAERVKCKKEFPIGLNEGRSVAVDEFTFHGIPAKHNEIERDENGNCKYIGYVIAFGKNKIYHSGDTLWFDQMVDLLRPFAVDVAILPINGNDPARKVAGNLNCREAVKLAKAIGAKLVIPCHYDMFTFNTADVNEFITEAKKMEQPYKVLRGGERFSSN